MVEGANRRNRRRQGIAQFSSGWMLDVSIAFTSRLVYFLLFYERIYSGSYERYGRKPIKIRDAVC